MISRKRIRLACDPQKRADISDYLKDVFTSATPELWRGNDVQFEIALYNGTTLETDLSNIASLTLTIRQSNASGAILATKTIAAAALDDSLTAETWTDNTKQHALVTLTSAETNIAVGSHWLVIDIATNDTPGQAVTLGATTLKIVEDGAGSAGEPEVALGAAYSKSEADARYVQIHADGAAMQWYDGRWYIYNSTTALWYPLSVTIVDDIPTLTLGEGVSL
jgi:hypothetical protein